MSDQRPDATRTPRTSAADEPPGVPGFRTWRGVYWFVFAIFILVIIALTLFSRLHA